MSAEALSTHVPRAAMKFDSTLGALLIGGLLGMVLWGVTSVQAYNYFTHIKNRDTPLLKAVVAVLWAFDTLDSALSSHTLYYYLVSNYGNLIALLRPSWSIISRIALTSVTNYTIRILFAHRVYRLSEGNILMTGWIVLISTAQLGIGILVTVKTRNIYFSQLTEFNEIFYAMFCVSTASDISVTVILAYLLRRSRTGYRRTDTIIKVLMAYTVNTGFIVAVDAVVALIAFVTMPHNLVAIAFYLLISKLYLNSYLAALNAREMLRNKAEASMQLSGGQSSGRRDMEDTPTNPRESFLHMKSMKSSDRKFMPVEVHVHKHNNTLKDSWEPVYPPSKASLLR